MRQCLSGTSASPSTLSNSSVDAWASGSNPSPRRQFTHKPLFNSVFVPHFSHSWRGSFLDGGESDNPCELFIRLFGCCGKRSAEMADFIVHLGWIFDGVRYFIAQQPPITQAHIMQLLFHRAFRNSKCRGQISI